MANGSPCARAMPRRCRGPARRPSLRDMYEEWCGRRSGVEWVECATTWLPAMHAVPCCSGCSSGGTRHGSHGSHARDQAASAIADCNACALALRRHGRASMGRTPALAAWTAREEMSGARSMNLPFERLLGNGQREGGGPRRPQAITKITFTSSMHHSSYQKFSKATNKIFRASCSWSKHHPSSNVQRW
eukprot:scaffold85877_cov34-Tisochrysis_lutea.AAC.2